MPAELACIALHMAIQQHQPRVGGDRPLRSWQASAWLRLQHAAVRAAVGIMQWQNAIE